MIIRKIFEGDFDSEVHSDFVKFSRGEFKNKYLIDAKKQASKWTIKAGSEFANFLVKSCLNYSENSIKATGIIATTSDLKGDISFDISKVSQFQGVKKYVINCEIKTKELIELMNKFPRAFYALSFSGTDFDLKIKAKAPKSGKHGKEDEEIKADFCTIKTNDKKILDEFFFDCGLDWKEIKISHTIKINNIVYPKDMDKMSPIQVRENSKREGVLVRYITIDGVSKTSEAKFLA
jgi:hypothetical protein